MPGCPRASLRIDRTIARLIIQILNEILVEKGIDTFLGVVHSGFTAERTGGREFKGGMRAARVVRQSTSITR